MGEDLGFEFWLKAPPNPGEFVTSLMQEVRTLGFGYGGFFYDAAVREEPPIVRSDWDNRRHWQNDFVRALKVSSTQGWAAIALQFDLPDVGDSGLMLYAGPKARWLPSEPRAKQDPGDAKWWVVRLEAKLGHFTVDSNMERYLAKAIIPLCRKMKPLLALGDVDDWGKLYRPTIHDLDSGMPRQACWFNYYSAYVIDKLGRRDWFEKFRQSKRWRVETYEDGSAILIVTSIPQLDEREWARSALGLRASSE